MSEENLNPKKRGLGRGLNALFEDDESGYEPLASDVADGVSSPAAAAASAPKSGQQRIPLDLIYPGNVQPRKDFDEDALERLADSVKQFGVLQPILLKSRDDGNYDIIAGERRFIAAQRAGLSDIPALIVAFEGLEALEVALIENLQREDLNPIEEAYGYQRILDEHGQSADQLAKAIGRSRSHVANMTRLLQLPEIIQAAVRDGALSMGHARALINAKEPEALADRVIKEGLSVRQTEELAKSEGGVPEKPSKTKKSKKDGAEHSFGDKDVNILALEGSLMETLGMRVSIDTKKDNSGSLSIEYKTLDQLDDLLARLSGQAAIQNRLME